MSFVKDFTNVIICGDFNAHHKMWDNDMPNTNGQHFINFIDKYDYTILNTTKPTYFSFQQGRMKSSPTDMSLASPNIFHKCSIEVTEGFLDSDHCIINAKVNVSPMLQDGHYDAI